MSRQLFILLAIVLLATKFGTDFYCVIARRFGIIDKPDQRRKLQDNPVPVGGGVVIWLVLVITELFTYWSSNINLNLPFAVVITASASLLLVLVGLYDDKFGMRGKYKLFFQILVSTVVVAFANSYSSVLVFGYSFNLGHLFFPLAIFWLVGLINSLNLLDGADGVVTSLGIYMLLAAAAIGVVNEEIGVANFALIAAASLVGFFLCNRPPAKVYLGDTGSMLLGLLIGVLLLRASTAEDHSIEIVPAICVIFLPLLDSVFAIIRRKNARRSIFSTDRAHIHHRIQKRWGKGNILLVCLAILQLPLCAGAVAGVSFHNDLIPLGAMFGVFLFLVVTGIFGRNELFILFSRFFNLFKKRFSKSEYDREGSVFHTQGSVNWLLLWKRLLSQVKRSQAIYVSLDINIPSIGEDFHTEWHNLSNSSTALIVTTVPFLFNQQLYGTLTLHFDASSLSLDRASDATRRLHELCVKNIDQLHLDKADRS